VFEPATGASLAREERQAAVADALGKHELERDRAPQVRVPRFPDLPHAPLGDEAPQLEPADLPAGGQARSGEALGLARVPLGRPARKEPRVAQERLRIHPSREQLAHARTKSRCSLELGASSRPAIEALGGGLLALAEVESEQGFRQFVVGSAHVGSEARGCASI
jgi:hypothetical protein